MTRARRSSEPNSSASLSSIKDSRSQNALGSSRETSGLLQDAKTKIPGRARAQYQLELEACGG
jgi:hypothetical protein